MILMMGKIIFNHMSDSKKISAHVQSFVEVDVSNVWDWREKYKRSFQENEGQKLTFTPIFISAVVKSLKDFPILNSSVVDDKIVIKRSINIGMATAVDNGNLIVPVIKNADHLNLKGLAIAVNDLSKMIHQIDPNHPTTTMLAGAEPDEIKLVAKRCPDLDLLSFQIYGEIDKLPSFLKKSNYLYS